MMTFWIDGENLSLEDVVRVASNPPREVQVGIAEGARTTIRRGRRCIEEALASGKVHYGINTGFGAFKDKIISADQVKDLQRNIVVSHSVGVGPAFDQETVRAAILIRANTLAKGHSGVRLELVEALIELLNHGVYPLLPCQGSLGASGDLAPLAHMALVLIGEGEADSSGREAVRGRGLASRQFEAPRARGEGGIGADQWYGGVLRGGLPDHLAGGELEPGS